MKVALDSNILAYAEGVDDEARQAASLSILSRLPPSSVVVPAQALGELFSVLVRKGRRTRRDSRQAVLRWRDAFPIVGTSPDLLTKACDLAVDHELGLWDSIILAAAAEAGCRVLLSEDMQDGFTWGGVTVANPFATTTQPALGMMLGEHP